MPKYSNYPVISSLVSADIVLVHQNSSNAEKTITFANLEASIADSFPISGLGQVTTLSLSDKFIVQTSSSSRKYINLGDLNLTWPIATAVANGNMSASDKALMDTATDTAVANSLVRRGGFGNVAFGAMTTGAITASSLATLVGGSITLGGTVAGTDTGVLQWINASNKIDVNPSGNLRLTSSTVAVTNDLNVGGNLNVSGSISGGISIPDPLYLTSLHINSGGSITFDGVGSNSIDVNDAGALNNRSVGAGNDTIVVRSSGGGIEVNGTSGLSFFNGFSATTYIYTGTGSPEGSKTAEIGSLYLRLDGSTSTTLYVKTSGSGNTGWTAK